MTKRIICLSLVVLLLFIFAGCSDMSTLEEETPKDDSSMFVVIEHNMHNGYHYSVVYHKETKVMYALNSYNHFTVMVDAEGNPLLYSEDLY